MDFGDILDAWDRQTAKGGRKKGGGTSERAAPGEARVDPLTAWLRVNGVQDKDADAEEETGRQAGERRRRLLNKRPEGVLDLHGLNRDEAWDALEIFFEESRRQGFEKILVVHGKGNHSDGEAVLKKTVRGFIERCPFAGESGHSSASDGGSGATWVLLRTPPRRG